MTTLVVPTSDLVNRPLYDKVANLQSLITANATKNPAHVAQWRQQLPEAQRQLVDSLIATNRLSPSFILATVAYGAGDSNSSY